MNKSELEKINELLKSVRENKTFSIKLYPTYKVLILNEKSVKALQTAGFTELKTTYLSSKKYSEKIIDILISELKKLGYSSSEKALDK